MKDKKRKIVLLKSINENMNAVVVNQEIIYSRLEAIIKKMDKLEKDHNVIIETTSKIKKALHTKNGKEGCLSIIRFS